MLKDMVGFQNDYFEVIEFFGYKIGKSPRNKRRIWRCVCKCGKEMNLETAKLNSGKPMGCGCRKRVGVGNRSNHSYLITHGLANKHPFYKIWIDMNQRCFNPKNHAYRWYGAKGVRVCDEWRYSFVDCMQWCIQNGWQKGLVIDRINSAGDYGPNNCQFLTISENTLKMWKDNPRLNTGSNSNRSKINEDLARNIKLLSIQGLSVMEISLKFNLSYNLVYHVVKNNTWKHVEVDIEPQKNVQ